MEIKRILISQPKPTSEKSPYYDIATRYGVEMVFRPFIRIDGLSAKEFRQSKINPADYTAVIFTSRHAVDNYFRLCEELRFNVPDTMRYFCTMESIAHYLQKYIVYRKRKISFGLNGKLNDPQLVQAIVKNKKEKFLYPISDVHTDVKEPALEDLKIDYTPAVMYRTVSNDFTPDEPFDYDMLIFFSPAGIDALLKNFPNFSADYPDVKIGAFGVKVAQAVRDAGLRLDIEAPTEKVPSMPAAIDAYLRENSGND